jgi:hypothetical protein
MSDRSTRETGRSTPADPPSRRLRRENAADEFLPGSVERTLGLEGVRRRGPAAPGKPRFAVLPVVALAAVFAAAASSAARAARPDEPRRAGRLEDCAPARTATMLRDRVLFSARENAPVALGAELVSDLDGEEDRAVRWRLVVTTLDRQVVDERSGVAHLAAGRALVSATFDGRDASGRPLAAGTYVYRFEAPGFDGSGAFLRVYATDETPDETPDTLAPLAASTNPNVPYNFYFGSQHAHTAYSDGGIPLASCTGSVSSPHSGAAPSDAFAYAKANGNVDFICVLEHNHLIDDACGSCTAAAAAFSPS